MENIVSPSRRRDSLSFRLLGFVIGVIMLVELILLVPSSVTFRDNWLDNRLQAAHIAALALRASPSQGVSDELTKDLLLNAEVQSVAVNGIDTRHLLIASETPQSGKMISINRTNEHWTRRLRHTFSLLLQGDDTVMKVSVEDDMVNSSVNQNTVPRSDMEEVVLEVIIPEKPLQEELYAFIWRILGLSLIISVVAGGFVYLVLDIIVVKPMRTVTASIMHFRNDPGKAQSAPPSSTRKDEIGRAQNALADMERVVSDAFRQRERLAHLGEAVAKINHDLRNSLGAAQLISEGLANSEDPRVKRAAPRLERAIERAIKLAQDTLQYGKADLPKPNIQNTCLSELVEEAAKEALAHYPGITFHNKIADDTYHACDPDHLHRIVANLVRNAAQATEAHKPGDGEISIAWTGQQMIISDNGPGLPEIALENIFTPFAGSVSKGGTGLGLAIAHELSRDMGGNLELGATGANGTVFVITLP